MLSGTEIAVWLGVVALTVASGGGALSASKTEVAVSKESGKHEVTYVSADVAYVEGLVGDHWVGRYWSADGRVDKGRFWNSDAFYLKVQGAPFGPEMPLDAGWDWVGSESVPAKSSDSVHYAVRLENKHHQIALRVHTLLDGTPVMTRWLEITNTGPRSIALTSLSPWSGRLWNRDAPVAWLHSTQWVYPWEGWIGWEKMRPGLNAYRNDKGLVWDDPFFVVRNESNGEYFIGELAWPANFVMEFRRENGLTFRMGPAAAYALRVLAPGETATSPSVHMGCVKRDFDRAVQAMHEHIRNSLLIDRKPEHAHLVQCLFPEDQGASLYHGNDFNEDNMRGFLDVCAAAGVDLFILDGPVWAKSYGDWVPRADLFPNGLGPLEEHAHSKDMLFGVYAEPEGGRGDWSRTTAWSEHQEWFIERSPYYPWRNFINLAIPEAAGYVESQWRQIIEGLSIDIYRHDQNGCFGGDGSSTLRDGFIENDYWRYYDALNGILGRLHSQYPGLILQQASGGGSRLDLDTIAHWHEHFTSDRATYPEVYRMSAGLSVYLPPEILVTANGMAGDGKHQPDFLTQLRAVYALGNTPMMFNAMLAKAVKDLDPSLLDQLKRYKALYQTFIRPMLSTCRVWHHAPVNANGGVESGNWFAMEFTSPDRSKGWATIVRLSDKAGGEYLLRPKGFNAKRQYRVTFDNTGKAEAIAGSVLMRDGIRVRVPASPCSELLLFDRDNQAEE